MSRNSAATPNEEGVKEIWVAEINKKSIGKAIIKWCGNEGTEDNEEQSHLRRLLQHVITFIEKNGQSENWKNVIISIHSINGYEYRLISDVNFEQKQLQCENRDQQLSHKHKYVAYVDEKDELVVQRHKPKAQCQVS